MTFLFNDLTVSLPDSLDNLTVSESLFLENSADTKLIQILPLFAAAPVNISQKMFSSV